jgi:hypothetical protein
VPDFLDEVYEIEWGHVLSFSHAQGTIPSIPMFIGRIQYMLLVLESVRESGCCGG